MIEKKGSYVFNEKLILKQLFDDLENVQALKINSSAQKNRPAQESVYQVGRQRKRQALHQQEQISNTNLNKKKFEMCFWDNFESQDEPLLAINTALDNYKENLKIESTQPSRRYTFGYVADSSGE